LIFVNYFIIIFIGLVLGSFSTALIYRMPRRMPWLIARSECTSCKKTLAPRDLIPVFSWLMTRGKCRQCGQEISARYPITEACMVLGCLGIYWSFGLSIHAFLLIAILPFLVALLVIDLEEMILPDPLVAIVAIIGVIRLVIEVMNTSISPLFIKTEFIAGFIVYGLLAWLLGWLMKLWKKQDALGFGDVKFFAVAGLWLGLSQLGVFLLIAGLLGVWIGIIWKMTGRGKVFPFGPALILSLYLLLMVGGFSF
jgi:leader peptidase (prepilin peptidase)/N-methyltransferase